jgi:glycosyltransferase involved in cell wall biosynthesis
MSGVPSDTGFAWNNIHALFDTLVEGFRSLDVPVLVSFPIIRGPAPAVTRVPPSAYLEVPPPGRSLSQFARLLRVVRDHDVRYVYLTDARSVDWRYGILRLAGVRAIIVHNRISVPDPAPAHPDYWPKRLVKQVLARVPGFCADRTYAVSNFVRHRLIMRNRVPAERVIRILNGVSLARFRPVSWDGGAGPVKIFAGCRADWFKGIQVLIEASYLLCSAHELRAFKVQFAGDGPHLGDLKALVRDKCLEEHFEFLGEVRSTELLQLAADIIVVPSIWGDACPSSVSEAMASGKPLIATEAGGIPELVGDRANAILVPPGNASALAHALASLIRDPNRRRDLGLKARQRAEAALSAERYHREVLEQLVADCGFETFDHAPVDV